MATDINFTKRDGKKEYAEIKPTVPVVVQIEREDFGFLTIYGNLDDMKPTTVFNDNHIKDLIFQVDVPAGVTVTIESGVHVLSAKMIETE